MFLAGQISGLYIWPKLSYLGNFCFIFPDANIFSLELQYLSGRQLQFLQNVNDNIHSLLWKNLNNVAAFLSITRYPSEIEMYFLYCCWSVWRRRQKSHVYRCSAQFSIFCLLYFYIYSFAKLYIQKIHFSAP